MPSGLFSGDNRYRLDLSNAVSSTTITASISVTKTAGGGYSTGDPQWWRIRIAGVDQDGTWTYDFSGATPKTIGIATRGRNVGYGTFLVESWVNMDSGIGQAYASEWITINNPATVPPAPRPVGIDTITPTGMTYRFAAQGDGGAPITRWEYQAWPDPTFSGAGVATAGDGVVVRNDIAPATVVYWRVRGVNGVGAGPWSSVISERTRGGIAVEGAISPVFVSVDGAWKNAAAYVSNGSEWKAAG